MNKEYFQLFLTVLKSSKLDHQSIEQWGKTAKKQTEELMRYAGVGSVDQPTPLPPPEPGAAPPAAVEVVTAAPAAAIGSGHPFGPAFDGWDQGQLRVILIRSQELALAKQHGADDITALPAVTELLEAVEVLGEMWAEKKKA